MAEILVVDDEPDIRMLVRLALEHQGHRVRLAGDGEEALAAVEAGLPDLVVLDVMMPTIDGWGVLEQIKKNPEASGVPVLMLTALGAPLDRVRGGIEGAVRYLTKPVDLDELVSSVDDVLAGDELDQRRSARTDALELLARIERNGSPLPAAAASAPRLRLSGLERGRIATPVQPPGSRINPERLAELTVKQLELLRTVAGQPTVTLAAEQLGTSRSNVYASLRRISRKLGTRSVQELLGLLRARQLVV